MDSIIVSPCPSCGHELNVPSTAQKFVCQHCHEELTLTPEKRIFLAHPISPFAEPQTVRAESQPRTTAGQTPEAYSIKIEDTRRRQSSLEKSLQKIAGQRDESTRRVKLGLGILVLGVFLLVAMLARLFLANGSWVELGISILAILGLIPLGLFLVISSSMIIRLLGKQEQELRKENVGR